MLMRKTWIYGAATLIVLGALTTACGSKEEVASSGAAGLKDPKAATTVAQGKTESSVKKVTSNGKPAIDADYKVDGRNVTITYQTSNFQIADHMDQKAVQGEGHLHLYVDGKQKAMIGKTGPLTLTNLAAGKHEIRLELQQNDHKDLNVEKILNIEVK
ncbi:DUF6130 family protein [Paenibacillus alginolyticus]|uniref:DUF6130 family protein n=1 Tax=Paenibacillus alginolyticus TaxID=59839 RepID=A0ABT4GH33_9BACL|nr:DUF6130 family protein [Paenibacillus alginolyticus]MCY9695487.1 DUF6130 family protein [Paenibacillus alginolyticus]MEC0148213.1 DUF6130 family protein [Paenibacillus alginolyticus]